MLCRYKRPPISLESQILPENTSVKPCSLRLSWDCWMMILELELETNWSFGMARGSCGNYKPCFTVQSNRWMRAMAHFDVCLPWHQTDLVNRNPQPHICPERIHFISLQFALIHENFSNFNSTGCYCLSLCTNLAGNHTEPVNLAVLFYCMQ